MKILYCLNGTFNSGGTERIVISKANWFAAHGHEVIIVTSEQKGRPDFYPLYGVKRIDLEIMYSETAYRNPFKKYVVQKQKLTLHKKKLMAVIEAVQPDMVISTFGNEIRFVSSLTDKSKKIAEIHFTRWYRLRANRKGIWYLIDRYLTYMDYKILGKYDRFVCLTQEDRQNWQGLTNIIVMPNFVDSVSNSPAELTRHAMIAVGRFSYEKGYERMIAAWETVHAKYPDWTLDIYGGGELQDDLQRQISALKLDGVVNLNPPVKDIQAKYLKHSALVLSSRNEGMPMVLLEAMACGLPLISYTCQCGPKDLIRDEYNGLLVPEGDVDGLAQAIMRVIEDEKLRKRMGANALEESKNYLQDAIMPRWENLLHNLLTTSRRDG